MQKINGIKLKLGQSENLLKSRTAKLAGVSENSIKSFKIIKKSLDARDKNNIFFTYNVEYSLTQEVPVERDYRAVRGEVTVIGSGPCGLFCALYLARHKIKVTLIERGSNVEKRAKTNENFIKTKILSPECNVQFGEGGAGTFSDGKLNTQVNNERVQMVLEDFVKYGAPSEILYLSKPHIGSDNLPRVVANIRNQIINLGGEVIFDAKVNDFCIENGQITGITYLKEGQTQYLKTNNVVLAIGHSSRDTFEKLYNLGVAMESKDFAVGFRIEHLQNNIGFAQYGKIYKELPSADYKLVSHAGERDVFTFCMCPGGYVMPATSEEGGVVVNGMSEYKRDGVNANSAIVCKVTTADYDGSDALAGVRFQRDMERRAYLAGGGNYKAPVQLVKDFISGKESSSFGEVLPTYPMGTQFYQLNNFFEKSFTNSLISGIIDMDKRLKGFAVGDAILTGVESRTSSPLRILRDLTMQSVNVKGLYPAGEGAGYAGGITSAAADGIKVAYAIVNKLLGE
ncbi:MAG: FAD-dependent oxidoreductase [Clostridia bacterium]|nr:FAD-dependent oxidoreductase [Clostridia bacterium]